jgi:hypothetical protein
MQDLWTHGAARVPVKAERVVPRDTFYLAAPKRTQDLLNIKWALQAAGYAVGSTWHDCADNVSRLALEHQWNRQGMKQLQLCDSLAVVCGKAEQVPVELATMAGFALARGLQVIWIGSPLRMLSDFGSVQQFDTASEFQQQIFNEMYPQVPRIRREYLAA